jgi:UDP-N-acetylmuramoylalanine--D-glutamate ligase
VIEVSTFANRKVALFGLGGSGMATARALRAGGAEVVVGDDNAAALARAAEEGFAVADIAEMDWKGITALVLAPGVPLTHRGGEAFIHPAVAAARKVDAEVIGDIELFCRERAARNPESLLIAITGTNGKSTTTALIAHVMRSLGIDAQLGGNIGKPVLELDPPSREHANRVHVLEVSSFQIDLAPSLEPTVSVLLNITPDHLDRHGDMETYAAIKERLVAKTRHAAYVGIGNPLVAAIAARHAAAGSPPHVWRIARDQRGACEYTLSEPRQLAKIVEGQVAWMLRLPESPALRGFHNAENAAFAYLVAYDLGIQHGDVMRGLATFPGLPHRMEEVGRIGRTIFINDSKATNADSTEKALKSFEDGVHWIVGGTMKQGGITPLSPLFRRVAKAYLIGASSDAFASTLDGRVPYERCETLDRAVSAAARDAAQAEALSEKVNPVVLLSPACASYDQFKNFEMRGDRFRTLATALIQAARDKRP